MGKVPSGIAVGFLAASVLGGCADAQEVNGASGIAAYYTGRYD